MKPENDQLAVLRRLQSEGRISKEEYEDLTAGLVSVARSPAVPENDHHVDRDPTASDGFDETNQGDAEPSSEEGPNPADGLLPPRVKENISGNYLGALAIASLGLVVISMMGMLPWLVTIPAIVLFLTTLFEGWRAVTLIGVVVWGIILLIGLAFSVSGDSQPEPVVVATMPPRDPYPPVEGSLNVYLDQLPDLWNTVDAPPRITKGLTRYNETGEYDTFLYRFGTWGRVAGAFDPDNEAIYALLITGRFSGAATDQLYLHLCYVVAPYSQECIDSYRTEGLAGGALEDFTDLAHEAEWNVGDQTWRLEIDENVMTIRVYGPDTA